MTISPMNPTARLNAAPRCGARTRAGGSCRCPAVHGRPRCRLHGCARGSGGQLGQRNGAYRHGRATKQAKEVIAMFRELAKGGEVLLATTLDRVGLGRKIPPTLRRRSHIRRARAAAKAKAKEGTK
jgi:hypothetical protein